MIFRIRSQLNPVGDQEGGRDLIELLKKMEKLDELRLLHVFMWTGMNFSMSHNLCMYLYQTFTHILLSLHVCRLYGNQLSTDRFRNLEPVIARMTNLRILV